MIHLHQKWYLEEKLNIKVRKWGWWEGKFNVLICRVFDPIKSADLLKFIKEEFESLIQQFWKLYATLITSPDKPTQHVTFSIFLCLIKCFLCSMYLFIWLWKIDLISYGLLKLVFKIIKVMEEIFL